MCLITNNSIPFIASENLQCIKYIKEKSIGKFYSPYQYTPIHLNEPTIAVPETPRIIVAGKPNSPHGLYLITSGAIHAALDDVPERPFCDAEGHLAIIPKGTEYWVDYSCNQIAARQMIITSHKASVEDMNDSVFRDILKNSPEKGTIKIADFVLNDYTYIHPKDLLEQDIPDSNVIGRVVGFGDNGTPLIASIKEFRSRWDDVYTTDSTGSKFIFPISFRSQYTSNCKNKEWNLPTVDELGTMMRNKMYLDTSVKLTNIGYKIETLALYWSRVECSSKEALGVSCSLQGYVYDTCSKEFNFKVVPFLYKSK